MATESPYWLIFGENGVSTFSQLLLTRSFLYLQVKRTCIKSRTSSNFGPDRTTDYGVSCPWASKKFPIDLQWENGDSMLARSFFIRSSKLLVTRTGIKAWLSSILGRIRPLILELLALEWWKFHTFELEYLWSQLVNLDQILCVAALGWGKGCIRFWGRLDHSGERSLPFGLLVLCWIFTVSVVAKPLIDLNHVWYEWMQDSKMLQKGKACLRRAALSGDRSYYFLCFNRFYFPL